MHESNEPDLVEHTELDWADSDLHNTRTVGKTNLQPHGLSEFGGPIHGSLTPQTSTPFCNPTSLTVRLYEQQRQIVCWFTDTKWQLTNNSRSTIFRHKWLTFTAVRTSTSYNVQLWYSAQCYMSQPIRPMSQSINLYATGFKWLQSTFAYDIIFAWHLNFCTWFTKNFIISGTKKDLIME